MGRISGNRVQCVGVRAVARDASDRAAEGADDSWRGWDAYVDDLHPQTAAARNTNGSAHGDARAGEASIKIGENSRA